MKDVSRLCGISVQPKRSLKFTLNNTHGEWLCISFEIIDMLMVGEESIRRVSVNCFGYISKALGPREIILKLINNFREKITFISQTNFNYMIRGRNFFSLCWVKQIKIRSD